MADNSDNQDNPTAVPVTLSGIDLSFGKTRVLKGIDLAIHAGEFFAFLGPSGCGKTTMIRLIAGFESSQAGSVYIGGQEVSHLPPWRRNVGMVFQNYALWPHMTVRKNVAFGLEERRLPGDEIRGRVDAALELVGLLALAERRPSQLSGGQQQRVALARTIVVEPKILLLDEPLSNLDAKLRVQMRRELLHLQRKLGITTVFVTHDQEEANTTADRIAVMNDGIIQQIGAPTELYDRPANRFVAGFLGTANLLDGTVRLENGRLRFETGGGISIGLASARDGGGWSSPGPGTATLLVRPQNIEIRTAEAAEKPGRIALRGVVKFREFLGSLVRYGVRVGENDILVDDIHKRDRPALGLGTPVRLTFAEQELVFLPR